MAQVFLSYAKEDRTRVEKLVRALKGAGISVFWDRDIPPGQTWRQVLERELAAPCVVVVWTEQSLKSTWVLEEVEAARGRVFSVLLENVVPPFGFRQQQAANLVDWKGEASDPAWIALCMSIAERLNIPAPALPPQRRPKRSVFVGVTLLLAAAGTAAWAARRPGPAVLAPQTSPPAPTPEAPGPDQTPEAGTSSPSRRRVYFETFSDPTTVAPNLWALGTKGDWAGKVENGEYELCNASRSASSSYTASFSYLDGPGNPVSQTDAAVMLTVRMGTDPGNYSMAGVLFRATPDKASYFALARSAGHSVTVLRKEGSSVKLLSTWGLPAVADDAPVTLRAESDKEAVRLFVGDKQIDMIASPAQEGQRNGVFAMGKGCFFFDDASLYLPRE